MAAREFRGRIARSAAEIEEAHPVLRLENEILQIIVAGERRTREHAGAVVRVHAAVGAEHVVIGAVLVVMLEEIGRTRRPFDELALLECVEPVADPAGILRMCHHEKQHVVEEHVGRKQSEDDQHSPKDDRNGNQGFAPVNPGAPAALFMTAGTAEGGPLASPAAPSRRTTHRPNRLPESAPLMTEGERAAGTGRQEACGGPTAVTPTRRPAARTPRPRASRHAHGIAAGRHDANGRAENPMENRPRSH